MMVSERERNAYSREYDYASLRNDRYARYDYESSYEQDRSRTSQSYRDSLMSSLERPASRSRLERSDENRYGFYMSNIGAGENNYDKFWDAKHQQEQTAEKAVAPKRRLAFMVTYIVVAVVALVAVTLTVLGLGGNQTQAVAKPVEIEQITASAETDNVVVAPSAVVAAEEPVAEEVNVLGENYIMLKSGEIVAVEAPERPVQAKEEEKGFDKFCTWLNNVFGG